jgi:hypothetical protein
MLLTFYRVSARRGSLLAQVVGIVVHDHWASLLHDDRRAARAMQRAPSARTEGAGRD